MDATRRNFVLATAAVSVSAVSAAGAPKSRLWSPKLSENLADVNPDTLRWLKQFGCQHVIFQGTDGVDTERKGYWSPGDVRPRRRAANRWACFWSR